MIPNIKIEDYNYPLPEHRIAKYPLENRDDSKLLVNTDGIFRCERFRDIAGFLPEDSFMVFNETKVVPARLFFKRETGAVIEIFCLEPSYPEDYQQCFSTTERCRWKAIVGNLKKWKGDRLTLMCDHCASGQRDKIAAINLKAELVERTDNTCIVEFSWAGGISFSQVITVCGNVPIPPYLNRETEPIDIARYQTTYARRDGSVAAPTAGLHFTERVMADIEAKGIEPGYVTLHVGAGTFLPVKSEFVADHNMHSEPFVVTLDFLERLETALAAENVIAVGTTSVRTLESLYYLGVHCIESGAPGSVAQWEPYRDHGYGHTAEDAIGALVNYLKKNNQNKIVARTCLIIMPGFEYRIVKYIVTNFHQPKSTLLLLVSAAIGDGWRDMYQFALDNDFRFLSYGDSSLLKVRR
ncbi:MAG: S-adenosylmethionine:tRNA ribosyltransferase-isomerase [Bacteroidales bacterium]|nr:S-adenosylmethionine:tRNA ribosyltransferase-isomerase [Bacteroidales bacterium]